MLTRAWKIEIGRLIAVVLGVTFVGLIFGYPLVGFALGLVVYVAITLRALYRLEDWLRNSKKYYPPSDASGIWGEVFDHIYRMQKRKRKRKRQLSRIVHLFQQSTQAMPDGAVVLNKEFEITWINKAAQRLLGLKSPRDIGFRIDNFIRRPLFVQSLREGRFGEDIAMQSPVDPRIRLIVTVTDVGKHHYLVIAYDETEKFRTEQIQRDFVANVSHELRTPLTVVSGYLEGMAMDKESAALWGPPINAMERQVTRMRNIVNDLLLLAKLESGEEGSQPRPVDVAELVESIAADTRDLSLGRHEVEVDVDHGLKLLAAPEELRTAFSNLAFNAVRYTPEGGRIRMSWSLSDGEACFAVEDSGIGIPEHHIPRLSERFYRVDTGRSREQGGTGLGLAIVHQVLERRGGHLEVESEVDMGSTFRCVFPSGFVIEKLDSRSASRQAG
ncbi:MAG: phosphate regulon sensor histidine kinase PhoR [Gammaproteobacteria bacterium]